MKTPLLSILLLVLLIAPLGRSLTQDTSPLTAVTTIPMPKNIGHFDHFGVDIKGKRLFISDEDSNTVEAVSLDSGKHLYTIKGLTRPHNILYLPERNELIVTDGGGNVRFLRGSDYKVIRTVKVALNADFMFYDTRTKYVYVTNGGHVAKLDHGYLSIINTVTGKHLGDIVINGAHIEAVAGELNGPRIFVNMTDRNAVAVVDRNKKKVIAEWKIPEAGENIPIELDEKNKRLFVTCREPAQLVVFDTDSGMVISRLPIVGTSDDMSFDSARKRIYVSGEGSISVIQQDDPNNYSKIAEIPTGPGGHTSIFVPHLSRFFVASRPSEGSTPKLQVFEARP
jgi:DNA-binding beta-propeller fold protein YncE